MITAHVTHEEHAEFLREKARTSMRDMFEVYFAEGRSVARELIQRTPPLSGQTITRMLAARGAVLNDVEMAELSAKKVGERRVERDIRKVVYGIDGAKLSGRQLSAGAMAKVNDLGTYQRCEGKQAVRVFATKTGEVYGADITNVMPDASYSALYPHHQANRRADGRVTMAGQKTRNIGRWRWLNVVVAKEQQVAAYIKARLEAVGTAKGGWVAGAIACGAKFGNGWIGKHRRAGDGVVTRTEDSLSITMTNNSPWSTRANASAVVDSTLNRRAEVLEKQLTKAIDERWNA